MFIPELFRFWGSPRSESRAEFQLKGRAEFGIKGGVEFWIESGAEFGMAEVWTGASPNSHIQLTHKLGDKLSGMIADDLFWETMKLPNMVEKEPGNSYWIDIWGCRDYMGVLWETINNNQKGIVAITGRQFYDQVNWYDLPFVIWNIVR